MRRNLSRSEKHYLRQKRLHKSREAHRLDRLHVTYNPNKPAIVRHRPIINQKYRIHDPTRGKKIIYFPRVLNFRDQVKVTIDFLKELRRELLYGQSAEVLLEHRQLESISPEAAIVLLAELKRSFTYTSERKNVSGNYPRSPDAAKMLTDIGFYSVLNIKAPPIEKRKGGRTYFRVIAGNLTDGRIINALIGTFQKVVRFGEIPRKRLYAALTECMDNVRQHAYIQVSNNPDLIGEWWMAGFCDLTTAQLALVFFDQGLGIPTTLKTKLKHRIKGLIASDSGLIQEAVERGISSEDSKRRGTGLPSLKEFINELSPGGFLRVLSNNGDYSYYKNAPPRSKDLPSPLDGSLIVWSIQPNKEQIGSDGIIDLSL